MITTIDGTLCKRGDIVWEIGVSKEGYRPTRSVVYGPFGQRLVNEDKCWKAYDLCLNECNARNNEKSQLV